MTMRVIVGGFGKRIGFLAAESLLTLLKGSKGFGLSRLLISDVLDSQHLTL